MHGSRIDSGQRVALFIDGAYLSLVIKTLGLGKLSFRKFADTLLSGRISIATNYYDCHVNDDWSAEAQLRKQNFLERMEASGFNLRLGRLYKENSRDGRVCYKQKMIDTWLTAEAVELAAKREIDRAIVVAGDVAFVPLVRTLQRLGVPVELWAAAYSCSHLLRQIAICNEISVDLLNSCGCELLPAERNTNFRRGKPPGPAPAPAAATSTENSTTKQAASSTNK